VGVSKGNQAIKELIMLIFTIASVSGSVDKRDSIAATLYGEAASEGYECQMAVASVIWRRAEGDTNRLADVCLAPHQFCCWSDGQVEIKDDKPSRMAWGCAFAIATDMAKGTFEPTVIADNFHDERISKPPKSWGAVVKVKQIGRLTFYRKASDRKEGQKK
jgi:spore germination cell wall hydrolase CwlJ-like protein